MTTVLVIVGDINKRRLMAASVANDGHTVTTASTAAEALDILRATSTPVVAFFDYHLDTALVDVLPELEKDWAELQRHRYVMLMATPLDDAARSLAQRLGVVALAIPCSLGDLTWEITKKARELQAADGARRPPMGGETTQ